MKHRSLTETLGTGVSPAIDASLSALGHFPGFGVAVGLLQTVDDFRARAMAAKLASFLGGMQQQPPDAVNAMHAKLDDPEAAEKVTEALLLTMERYTSLKKCQIIGRLFRQYMNRAIDSEMLRRMAAAIDDAFIDDLEAYLTDDRAITSKSKPYQAQLVRAGLMELAPDGTVGGPGRPMYWATPLGSHMKSVLVPPARLLGEEDSTG